MNEELAKEIAQLLTEDSVWNLLRHGYKSPSDYIAEDEDSGAINRLYDISNDLIDAKHKAGA